MISDRSHSAWMHRRCPLFTAHPRQGPRGIRENRIVGLLEHWMCSPRLWHREACGHQHARRYEPHRQSVFAGAVDAVQAVNLTFDTLINEIDLSKMRVSLRCAV